MAAHRIRCIVCRQNRIPKLFTMWTEKHRSLHLSDQYPICNGCFQPRIKVHKNRKKHKRGCPMTQTATQREQTEAFEMTPSTEPIRPASVKVAEKPCTCEQHDGAILPWTMFSKNSSSSSGLTLYCVDYYKSRGYVRDIVRNPQHPLNPSRIAWLREHGYHRMLQEVGETGDLDLIVAAAEAEQPMPAPNDIEQITGELEDEDTDAVLLEDQEPDWTLLEVSPFQERRELAEQELYEDTRPGGFLAFAPADELDVASIDVLEAMPIPRPMSDQLRRIGLVVTNMANDLAAIESNDTTSAATIVQLEEQLAQVTGQLHSAERKIETMKREQDEVITYHATSTEQTLAKVREYYAKLRSVGVVIPKEYEI